MFHIQERLEENRNLLTESKTTLGQRRRGFLSPNYQVVDIFQTCLQLVAPARQQDNDHKPRGRSGHSAQLVGCDTYPKSKNGAAGQILLLSKYGFLDCLRCSSGKCVCNIWLPPLVYHRTLINNATGYSIILQNVIELRKKYEYVSPFS